MNVVPHTLVVDDGSSLSALEYPGSGPIILLLHDLNCDGNYWQPVVAALQARCPGLRIIIPDLRGHGASTSVGETSRRRLVKDLRRWCKELRLEQPLTVGHGWGADIALASEHAGPVIAVNPLLGRPPAPFDGDVERPSGMRGASDPAVLAACMIGATTAKTLRRSRRDPDLMLVLADPLDLEADGLPELREAAVEEVLWQDGSRHLPLEYPVGVASLVLSWTEEA